MIKAFRWNGEEITYDDENLVTLVSRCVQISRTQNTRNIIDIIEGAYDTAGEELLYGDWMKLKKDRINNFL